MRSLLAAALISLWLPTVHAAPNDGISGGYARLEVGRSSFSLSGASAQADADSHGTAVRLFGGYRFAQGLGVELGYAALGSLQGGKARSWFGVATGRWPVGESFAGHLRLGLSAGRVSGGHMPPLGDGLTGSRTSATWGVGGEYRPQPNVALTLNYDDYGRLSDRVEARSLTVGFHYNF